MLSLKTFVLTMLATFVAGQGVTSALAPEASAPASCVGSYDGTFEISVAKVEGAKKRDTNVLAVSHTPERRASPCARPLLFFCPFRASVSSCPRRKKHVTAHAVSTLPKLTWAPQSIDPTPCDLPTPSSHFPLEVCHAVPLILGGL